MNIAALLLLVTTAWAGPLDPADPPVERFVLDNGLAVALSPDPSVPVVALELAVDVGAQDDPADRPELAHLVEHLVATLDEEAWAELGANGNASTSFSTTRYYAQVPRAALRRALWLDAARLLRAPDRITAADLDRERAAVQRELEWTVGDHGAGMEEGLLRLMLWGEDDARTLDREDRSAGVEATTLEEVRGFLARHYGPSRMRLAVAGDFELAATKAWIEETYGAIPPVELPARAEFVAGAEFEATPIVQQIEGDEARVLVGWRSAAAGDKATAAMHTLASIASGRQMSWVEGWLNRSGPKTRSTWAEHIPSAGGGLFLVTVELLPGVDPAGIGDDVRKAMLQLQIRGVYPEEVAEAREERRRSTFRALARPRWRARSLNAGGALGLEGTAAVAYWKGARGLEALKVEAALHRFLTTARPAIVTFAPAEGDE